MFNDDTHSHDFEPDTPEDDIDRQEEECLDIDTQHTVEIDVDTQEEDLDVDRQERL